MPNSVTFIILIALAIGVVLLVGFLVLVARLYQKVDQGRALIINKTGADPVVRFTGGMVFPVIHRAEVMELSIKTIEVDRRGKEGLICRDNIRADIKVAFFVRVNKTSEDVLKVAQSIGCARASNQATLEELFNAKFSEALKTVGKRMDFEELYTKRDDFKSQIIEVIGQDLNGYVLDDCAIDFLEQTPIAHLDAQNVLDAQGIRKITAITAEQAAHTNELKQVAVKTMKRQDVEAAEAIFELERQEADAKARQQREISAIQSRETAEAEKVASEERLKSETARIKTEEEVQVQEQNKLRQVEIAQKSRERAVSVEAERVEKDRMLEVIARERETELMRIEKEKAVEVEKKAIADVVASRVAVDRNVAQEEENIKELRVISEAKRSKDAAIIVAEGAAQEHLVKEIKAAEAGEQVARFDAKKKLVEAEAELESADKRARAAMRLAEGQQAELAAEGLAAARVKEADALAEEKRGAVDAKVLMQRMEAEAEGTEKQGMARARITEAEAAAYEKRALAEARGIQEKGQAEAHSAERHGLANAVAQRESGLALAEATRQKMLAEAEGLTQKAEAMKALDEPSRAHEEFRMRLEKEVEMEKLRLATSAEIAGHQAKTMSVAMGNAKINIVGGDGQFFDRFTRAVALGQSIDATIDHSESARKVVAPYFNGEADFRQDILKVLTESSLDSESIKNLSIANALRLLGERAGDPTRRDQIAKLVQKADELGLR